MALPGEVRRRRQRQLVDRAVAELGLLRVLGAGRAGQAAPVVVEAGELLGDPRRALLGEHELQVGVALHHARVDEVPQRPVRPPRDLEQEHHLGRRVRAHVRHRAAAVVVDRQPEVLARRPDRLVVGGVERRHARPGRARRAGGRRRSGRWPWPTRSPATEASTSCSMIWAMPARRPGAWQQKSASQRLCACRPAQRLVEVAVGRRPAAARTSEPLGKNGGTVFGKTTSATTPSASSSAQPSLRSSSCGRRRRRGCRRRGSRARPPSGRSRRGASTRGTAGSRRRSPRRGSRRRSRRSDQWWHPWFLVLVGPGWGAERRAHGWRAATVAGPAAAADRRRPRARTHRGRVGRRS